MQDLLKKLEMATASSRQLDAEIWELVEPNKMYKSIENRGGDLCIRYYPGAPGPEYHRLPRFTESLDAAAAIVPDGYDYGVSYSKQHGLETWVQKPFKSGICHQGYAPEGTSGDGTRAIALCIAALSARSDR